jgi:GntR family transcriptional regulator
LKDITSHIKLDFRSSEPIYTQIVRQMEQLVVKGELHHGDQLPTVRQVAMELRINFNTVARAYRILDESGLISTQRGRGTYIWDEPGEEVVRLLHRQGLEELTRRFWIDAARLGFPPEEVMMCLKDQLEKFRK